MSPKPFHATEACIACKKCEKACPVNNIKVTDRPVWGDNCTNALLVIIFVRFMLWNMEKLLRRKDNTKDGC